MASMDGQSYQIDNPCIIVEFDPSTGQIKMICTPTDDGVCCTLLAFLNQRIPQKIFGPKKEGGGGRIVKPSLVIPSDVGEKIN